MDKNTLVHNTDRFNVASNAIDVKGSGIGRSQINWSDIITYTTTDPGKDSALDANKFVVVYEA